MTGPLVAALDIGGTTVKGALIDREMHIVQERVQPTGSAGGPAVVLTAIRRTARELIDRAAGRPVVAVGAVAPGRVDAAVGIARYSANLGWQDVPLRELLAADTGLTVAVDHDVRAGALAERTLGAARGVNDCSIVIIGTGVAAVNIVGERELVGAHRLAGELGHVTVWPDGEQCPCGRRGCLEAYASAAAVTRRYLAAGGRRLTTPEIVHAAQTGEPLAVAVWQDAVTALALGLTHVVMLTDPELIVIGGGLAEAGDALLVPLRAAVSQQLTWSEPPEIRSSELGSRAGRLGAALLAWRAADVHGIER